jgi:lipopolysaccharide transport system permease protein
MERIITSERKISASMKELWNYRELLYFFAWRDYKIRYKETTLGILWAVLQPIFTLIVFVFFFGRFKEITNTGIPYLLFVYSGLVIWQFFSGSIIDAGQSLLSNSKILTKIYFPRLIIPMSVVCTRMIDGIFSIALLFALFFYFGFVPHWQIILLIPILFLVFYLCTSISFLLSAMVVRFRDLKYIIPFFVQLLMFLSPIIYSSDNPLFGRYAWILKLNPIAGIIDMTRYALYGMPVSGIYLAYTLISILVISFIGTYYFLRNEEYFADMI